MKNKKLIINIIFGVLLAVALTLIILGIVNLVKSAKVDVPDMLDPDWFDSKTSKNGKMFTGISLIFAGIFVVIVSSVIKFTVSSSAFRQAKSIYETVETISKSTENVVLEQLENISKPKTKKCPYCGSTLKQEDTVCENCGASQN